MFDAKYVATAMSIASQINWAFNFVVGIGFPVLSRLLGPWVFVPFGCVLLLVFLYSFFVLPETGEFGQRLTNGCSNGYPNGFCNCCSVACLDLESCAYVYCSSSVACWTYWMQR
jgi:hypothetical protein